jgi:two-component system osmolarity sensor histidine kinase EnvZ
MRLSPKSILPRGLFGRAALILIVPIVTIQLVVSIAFIQRHFEGVTRQLSQGVLVELDLIRKVAIAGPDRAISREDASDLAAAFGMDLTFPSGGGVAEDTKLWRDLTGDLVVGALREGVPDVRAVDLVSAPGAVLLTLDTAMGPMRVLIPRGRLSASNPHQLLILMIAASVLMTLISYAFLRNQLRPIARLARAAESFGKGETVPFRPRGATEVRAAGAAFLDMRHRIDRSIETRTLMLSGISHDLRTPLTRMRLGLSMLTEDDEVAALLSDVIEMERLVDEFLAFARGDAMEDPVESDPLALARLVVENAGRAGRVVTFVQGAGVQGAVARMRPQAVQRAVENLVGNGLRHGSRVRLTLTATDRAFRFVVEDDGPGIPDTQREAALLPFARLDAARDPNRGGGAGL